MPAYDGLFSQLKPNTIYSHIKLDENWDETFCQNKRSLLIIRLKSHAK
jgi:hypothetical protein